jgi:hypothetical protein
MGALTSLFEPYFWSGCLFDVIGALFQLFVLRFRSCYLFEATGALFQFSSPYSGSRCRISPCSMFLSVLRRTRRFVDSENLDNHSSRYTLMLCLWTNA